MAEIVIGRGNMAERVNAAREKIQEYLGAGQGIAGTKIMNQGSQSQNINLTKDNSKGYFDGYSKSVTNKHASKINLSQG